MSLFHRSEPRHANRNLLTVVGALVGVRARTPAGSVKHDWCLRGWATILADQATLTGCLLKAAAESLSEDEFRTVLARSGISHQAADELIERSREVA